MGRNEQVSVQKWPIVTILLIVINLVVFLVTHRTVQKQQQDLAPVKNHILMLASVHPELDSSDEVRQFVSAFSANNPESWNALKQEDRTPADEWDARTRALTNEYSLQEEMDSLVGQYAALNADSIAEKYAFVPSSPGPLSYITASFFHPGWVSLVLTMILLLMAGTVLEDAWGRVLFAAFYLAACAVSMQIRAWTFPGIIAPMMGASGVVAILMGALLTRFPLRRISLGKLSIPAVLFAPLWLIAELLYFSRRLSTDHISVFQYPSTKAHWIALAIFAAFGMVTALAFFFLHVERTQGPVQVKRVYQSGAATVQADQLAEDGQFKAAEAILKDVLKDTPFAVDALAALQQLYWRQNLMLDYQDATIKLCQAYIKERDPDSAWRTYEDYLNSGGFMMPVSTWIELCRIAEEQHLFDRAVMECEKLIALYPDTRESLISQLRAAKICLKQLGRPEHALKLFQSAQLSSVPHLDFEQAIANGIRESKVAISVAGAFPVTD